jgi:hypothetical protein
MTDNPWTFTCKVCGGQSLTVTRLWSILAGPESERWQEWGPLAPDHHWHYEYSEKIENAAEEAEEADDQRGDFGDYAEDDSETEPEESEVFEPQDDPEADEFYVNCADCDREIEFGWSRPERGGRIFPVECSDFIVGAYWPEPRYSESWQQKHWLPASEGQA